MASTSCGSRGLPSGRISNGLVASCTGLSLSFQRSAFGYVLQRAARFLHYRNTCHTISITDASPSSGVVTFSSPLAICSHHLYSLACSTAPNVALASTLRGNVFRFVYVTAEPFYEDQLGTSHGHARRYSATSQKEKEKRKPSPFDLFVVSGSTKSHDRHDRSKLREPWMLRLAAVRSRCVI